jgi:dihydroxy-acid dehydratase
MRLIEDDLRPSRILTHEAFENAIRTLHAIGGSTNAIIHLIAIAGRVGLDLPLTLFDDLSRTTPFMLDLKPSGRFLMEDFYYAGGLPTLLKELSPLLHLDALTITGQSLGANLAQITRHEQEVIRPLAAPLHPEGGLAVLYGSLAPGGALIKPTAASPELLTHRGRALVFEDHDDMEHRIDDPNLDVHPDDVLVMRNAGPLGAPGMPEWGFLPLPKKLLQQGIRDMVRISDARMSGTAFGTVVVHATPESAAGGPLAAVRTGDIIELDVPNRRVDLHVDPAEITRRLAEQPSPAQHYQRGYGWLFAQHILQADQGCDFDFLQAGHRAAPPTNGTHIGGR